MSSPWNGTREPDSARWLAPAEILRRWVVAGRVGHAYLFLGPAGMGKREAARQLARLLSCDRLRAGEPCGQCSACLRITRDTHPEVRVVVPNGATLKIDQVREAHQWLLLKPAGGSCRVCIFEQADRLTMEAGNALLAVLEDPPAHAILVLLAENGQAVLPTIRSRCHVLDFRPWPEGVLAARLEQEASTVPPRLAAALAQGNPGLALRLMKGEDLLAGRVRVEQFLEQTLNGEPANLYGIASELETYTRDRRGTLNFLDVLQLCLRDLLVWRITADRLLLVNRDRVDWIAAMASRQQPVWLLQASMAVAHVREAVRQNVARRLCLDLLVLRMIEGA